MDVFSITIFNSANNNGCSAYYQKCIFLEGIKSIVLDIYKNAKLCFTIYNNATFKSYLIDLECHPIL